MKLNQKSIKFDPLMKGLCIILFLLAFSPYHIFTKQHLTADDASYLAHAFSLGLDFNLEYKDNIADWINATGKAPIHPIGPGLLAAPFVSLFSIIDKFTSHAVLSNHAQYQYSWSYYGFVLATSFYFLMAVLLYRRAFQILKLNLNTWHLLFVSSSFGILFYVLFRPTMGHAYEFFSLSLCFYSSVNIFKKSMRSNILPIKYIFLCALSIILTLTIRPSNINVLLMPFIIGAFLHMHSTEKGCWPLKNIVQSMCIGAACLALCFLPIAFINLKIYGMCFPSADVMYASSAPVPHLDSLQNVMAAFSYLLSHLWQIGIILFSTEFGMIMTSSILVFGILFLIHGLFLKFRTHFKLSLFTLLLVAMYSGLPVIITLFWQSVGDAYGYRFFYGLFPLALLGYAYWHQRSHSKFLKGIVYLFCALSLVATVLFASDPKLLYHQQGTNSFGKRGGNAVGYNTAVLKSLPHFSTWLNLGASRAPGFFAMGLVEAFNMDIRRLPITDLDAKLEKYYSARPPFAVHLQGLLLAILFMVGTFKICQSGDKSLKIKNIA